MLSFSSAFPLFLCFLHFSFGGFGVDGIGALCEREGWRRRKAERSGRDGSRKEEGSSRDAAQF